MATTWGNEELVRIAHDITLLIIVKVLGRGSREASVGTGE
jgi:hypothetical protein